MGDGSTKVGGLKLKVAGNVSQGINNCLLNQSDLARSYCRNSTSWVENWILGFMIVNKLRKISFGVLKHTNILYAMGNYWY